GGLKVPHCFQERNRVWAPGNIRIHHNKPRITQVFLPSLHLSLNAVAHVHKHNHIRSLENYLFPVYPGVRKLRVYDVCSAREPYDITCKTGGGGHHQWLGINLPEHFVGSTLLLFGESSSHRSHNFFSP